MWRRPAQNSPPNLMCKHKLSTVNTTENCKLRKQNFSFQTTIPSSIHQASPPIMLCVELSLQHIHRIYLAIRTSNALLNCECLFYIQVVKLHITQYMRLLIIPGQHYYPNTQGSSRDESWAHSHQQSTSISIYTLIKIAQACIQHYGEMVIQQFLSYRLMPRLTTDFIDRKYMYVNMDHDISPPCQDNLNHRFKLRNFSPIYTNIPLYRHGRPHSDTVLNGLSNNLFVS